MEGQIQILQKTIAAMNDAMALLSESKKKDEEENAALKKQNEELLARVKELTAQVAWLNRQLFGKKSEKLMPYDPDSDLFADFFNDQLQQSQPAKEEAEETLEKETKEEKKKAKANRKMLEDLPVLETVRLEPENIDLSKYRQIGEEVTKIVEHKPGQLYVKAIIRPKYALINNGIDLPEDGTPMVAIASMPKLPIKKGIAGATLLSEILLQKYEYHMPFYRQIQALKQLGMQNISESTVAEWFAQTAELLRPLYSQLKQEVLKTDYIQADETTTPVLNKDSHKAAKEYLWMVRSVMEGLVIFHYEDGSRAGEVIKNLAKNYKGYLQCDGFAGYETAFKTNPDVTLVNCMAHIRRHFESALNENKAPAEYAIREIQHLYQIEHLCDEDSGMTPEKRAEKRQELARPIMESLKAWMEAECKKYSDRSLIGKAITYAYTRWDNMMNYLKDGRIRIDNNLAENAIRPITLGRKNYLFCGNHTAAENMAVVCSLLSTCKAQNVNPRDYLNYIIARMPYMEKAGDGELLELLPHKWKLQHSVSILNK